MSPPMVRDECKDLSTAVLATLAPRMLEDEEIWDKFRACTPDEIDVAFRWVGQAISNVVHKEGPLT